MYTNEQRMLALSERIKFIREARGLTQAEIANCAKVSRVRISQIESGAANPSFLTLCAIADALSIDVSTLTSIICPLPSTKSKLKTKRNKTKQSLKKSQAS